MRVIGIDLIAGSPDGGYDDFLARGSALIGSPEEVLDKIGKYQEAFGNSLISIGGHRGFLPQESFAASVELFASDVLPVLRSTFPDPPWPQPTATAS